MDYYSEDRVTVIEGGHRKPSQVCLDGEVIATCPNSNKARVVANGLVALQQMPALIARNDALAETRRRGLFGWLTGGTK